jgi:hypothetical protein
MSSKRAQHKELQNRGMERQGLISEQLRGNADEKHRKRRH